MVITNKVELQSYEPFLIKREKQWVTHNKKGQSNRFIYLIEQHVMLRTAHDISANHVQKEQWNQIRKQNKNIFAVLEDRFDIHYKDMKINIDLLELVMQNQLLFVTKELLCADMHELMDAVTPIQHETEIKLSEFVQARSYHDIESSYLFPCTPSKYNCCKCKHKGLHCGQNEGCINRISATECTSANCSVGQILCKNRDIQKRKWKATVVKKTEKKGMGLFAGECISESNYIIDYVGEIIGEQECYKRLNNDSSNKMYMLAMNHDHIIDASNKGNKARFINHSCNPNAKVVKWLVNQMEVAVITATRNIMFNEEITFNYNATMYGENEVRCHCDEENCTGKIGSKPKPRRSIRIKNRSLQNETKTHENVTPTIRKTAPSKKKSSTKVLKRAFNNEDNGDSFLNDDSDCDSDVVIIPESSVVEQKKKERKKNISRRNLNTNTNNKPNKTKMSRKRNASTANKNAANLPAKKRRKTSSNKVNTNTNNQREKPKISGNKNTSKVNKKRTRCTSINKEYPCPDCDLIFETAAQRNNHKRTHAEIIKCQYEGCSYKTQRVDTMQDHVDHKHTFVKRHYCRWCDAGPYYRSTKNGHQRRCERNPDVIMKKKMKNRMKKTFRRFRKRK